MLSFVTSIYASKNLLVYEKLKFNIQTKALTLYNEMNRQKVSFFNT